MRSLARFLILWLLCWGALSLTKFMLEVKKEHEIAQEKIQEEIDKLLSKADLLRRDEIANHKISIGMTDSEIIESIGKPDEKQSEVNNNVRTERWVYSTNFKGTLLLQETSDRPGLKLVGGKD